MVLQEEVDVAEEVALGCGVILAEELEHDEEEVDVKRGTSPLAMK
jgi:hypothetical protein